MVWRSEESWWHKIRGYRNLRKGGNPTWRALWKWERNYLLWFRGSINCPALVTYSPSQTALSCTSFLISSGVYLGVRVGRVKSWYLVAGRVAACLVCLPAHSFPIEMAAVSPWCPLQWMTAISEVCCAAKRNLDTRSVLVVGDPLDMRKPLYAHMEACECQIW